MPAVLLILMMGLDFGRVFLGWVNLNNTARIAANYAAANAQQMSASNAGAVQTYRTLVANDARAINCSLPNPIPAPAYSPNTNLGSDATVQLSCSFRVITPIISSILGEQITVSAAAVYPIRTGTVSGAPVGGSTPPTASFTAAPMSGTAPLQVSFTDTSTNASTWSWDFDGNGSADATGNTPPAFTYTAPGSYVARLTVTNGISSNSATRTIVVSSAPGPVANFSFTPTTGTAPLSVTFTDTSTGTPTAWAWDFESDGVVDATTQVPPSPKVYSTAGTYNASLTVTDADALTSTVTKQIVVGTGTPTTCRAPDFKNLNTGTDDIQGEWQAAGFDTTVIFNPTRPPDYKVTKQSLKAGDPFPCSGTVITVFDK